MHAPMEQPVFEPLTGVLHLAIWRASTRALNWGERQLAVTFLLKPDWRWAWTSTWCCARHLSTGTQAPWMFSFRAPGACDE
jgi:hypothetical protein